MWRLTSYQQSGRELHLINQSWQVLLCPISSTAFPLPLPSRPLRLNLPPRSLVRTVLSRGWAWKHEGEGNIYIYIYTYMYIYTHTVQRKRERERQREWQIDKDRELEQGWQRERAIERVATQVDQQIFSYPRVDPHHELCQTASAARPRPRRQTDGTPRMPFIRISQFAAQLLTILHLMKVDFLDTSTLIKR